MSALAQSTATRLTPEEADALPDAELFELIDGELKERCMATDAVWVATKVATRLDVYSETYGGYAFGDGLGLRLWPDGRRDFARADACYFAPGRFANGLPRGLVEIPPDVVVEVVSPGDLAWAVSMKVADYLEAGVRAVWLVFPNTRRIEVHRSGPTILVYPTGSELIGDPEMPGFRLAVEPIFPVMAVESEPAG